MSTEITDFDKEVYNQILKIRNEIYDYPEIGVVALCDYMKYKMESDEDEFFEDWAAIVNSAFNSPWRNRHDPLNWQINQAIKYEATRRAEEALK